jgi:hypothetical protein
MRHRTLRCSATTVEVLTSNPLLNFANLNPTNFTDGSVIEAFEHDRFVDAVEQFRREFL